MKRSNTVLPVAIAIIICTFMPANAQLCFRGKPLLECKTFWITEFGYNHRLDRFSDSNSYFTWETGLMRNVNRQTAIGATLFFGADPYGHRYGLKPRYRRWLNNSVSFDLGAGVLLGGRTRFYQPFSRFDKPRGPEFRGLAGADRPSGNHTAAIQTI
jgi:hypothetical protein